MTAAKAKLSVVPAVESDLDRARRRMRHLRKWGVHPVAVKPLAKAPAPEPPHVSLGFGVLVGLHIRNMTP